MRKRGFTLIELLVVVSIIALLLGILLPAISNAVDQAKKTQSMTNLKNIGTAMGSYSADWAGRQFTLIDDSIASYGNSLEAAFTAYTNALGGSGGAGQHPGARLGWGYLNGNGAYILFAYRCNGNMANASLTVPINMSGGFDMHFGSFRLINVSQFNQYVSGRFYDPIFYAPKDTIVINDVEGGETGYSCFNAPGEYCDRPPLAGFGDIPTWSSYVLSPAAMFAPNVMSHNGYQNYWQLPGGLRSPSMAQAKFPALKTHVLEHHWLQNRATECNPAFEPGSYSGCEPFYFNASSESVPNALFYDGHVEPVGVRKAERASSRNRGQTGWELWHTGTPFGTDGYFHPQGYDDAETSFHILTTDGIRGRDIVAD